MSAIIERMSDSNWLDVIKSRVLVCDGAMGTQLMLAGMPPGDCGALWNVNEPAKVESIHARYKDAGCDFATSNTFGGCKHVLAQHGAEASLVDLNKAGVQRARNGAPGCWVLADIGPFGDFLEPLGLTAKDEALAMFRDQAQALKEAGPDGVIIETMTDLEEMRLAIRAAKETGLPVIATYAFDRADGVTHRTMMGQDVPTCIAAALDEGADVVGANCGKDMDLDDYVKLAEALLRAAGGKPVAVQPNAGAPQMVDGRLTYLATSEQMAQLARQLAALGVRIVGGCCGTTPAHLKAIADAVKA